MNHPDWSINAPLLTAREIESVAFPELPVRLQREFEDGWKSPSDINEHCRWLRYMASQCEHVTEFGVRSGVSTRALMAGLRSRGKGNKLISFDVVDNAKDTLMSLSVASDVDFTFYVTSTLTTVPIAPTDMLFIDSYHTYEQLTAELKRHGDSVRRWIVFHDTKTFGSIGEDGTIPGLRQAITEYCRVSEFEVVYNWNENNGMMAIERVNSQP
jgi:predicted O-methyltransferase YrrM